ncbi:MAG: DUF433 domain-containing protein [Gemmataceae bacterium]|nr:DUF433 domain-containing protein [Gemmataceae bacterium]
MTETTLDPQPVPLHRDATGIWRVAGTRVPLERVITSYQAGRTAEQIAEAFDTLPLAAVYQVIGYYLSHKDAVEDYLREAEAQGEQVRQWIENQQQPSHATFRETLRARQAPARDGHAPTGQ